jgi:hypothetical protein
VGGRRAARRPAEPQRLSRPAPPGRERHDPAVVGPREPPGHGRCEGLRLLVVVPREPAAAGRQRRLVRGRRVASRRGRGAGPASPCSARHLPRILPRAGRGFRQGKAGSKGSCPSAMAVRRATPGKGRRSAPRDGPGPPGQRSRGGGSSRSTAGREAPNRAPFPARRRVGSSGVWGRAVSAPTWTLGPAPAPVRRIRVGRLAPFRPAGRPAGSRRAGAG